MGLLAVAARFVQERRFETIGPESISQDPSKPLIAALGGMPSASGVSVTERIAQGLPVVFACDKVIKQDVAKTPIKLKARHLDGTRSDDVNHPLFPILHDLPNPFMTAYEFKETMQCFLNLWGNAYAEIQRDARNRIVALWPLDSSRMTVDLDGQNRLRYTYRMAVGAPKVWLYDPANPPIFHLRQNTLDGIHGRGPIQVLRETFGIAIARDRYSARFYGQGGHAQLHLSTKEKLNEASARRIRQDYETLTVGEQNWHRVVILDHDLKPVSANISNRDAQFIEGAKLTRDEITGSFRVPAHKINNLEHATFSNIEHLAIEWVTDGLMPHFVCWQQAIARDLLTVKSFNTHQAVFIVDSLIRGDFKTWNDALATMRQNGVISANRWLHMLDMDDQIPADKGGDDYLVNGTMVPLRRELPAAPTAPTGGVN